MRLMNVNGRLVLGYGAGIIDVETASGGEFAPDVQGAFARWDELRTWAATLEDADPQLRRGQGAVATRPFPRSGIGPPVPMPPQVFAIGRNYRAHAEEGGGETPPEARRAVEAPGHLDQQAGPVPEVQVHRLS